MTSTLARHAASRLRDWIAGAFRDGEEPQDIHARRVALRRLRVACALFAPLAPPLPMGRCGRRLRRLAHALADVRTGDVFQELLAELRQGTAEGVAQAATEHLQAKLARTRRRDLGRARPPVRPRAHRALRGDLEALARSAAQGLLNPAFAQEALDEAFCAVARALPPLLRSEDPEALHAARLGLKRLRYTAELMEPLLEGWPDLLPATRALQEALGRHHDLEALETWLAARRLALLRAGRTTLAAGLASLLTQAEALRQRAWLELSEGLAGASRLVDLYGAPPARA